MKRCIKCNEEFPSYIVIDNKLRNLCNRKYCFKCSPWQSHNTKILEKHKVWKGPNKDTLQLKYNWIEIQKDYDNGLTWRDLNKKYHLTNIELSTAKKYELIKTRSRTDSQIMRFKTKPPYLHSDETKKLMSEKRKQYLSLHPDKVPYKLNHYSIKDSYPEQYFKDVFLKELIELQHHLQVELYQLDFYNESKKIYLEIDGEQHYVDERIVESDKIRNSKLFELGWKGMRLRWAKYQKLSIEEKQKVIEIIKNHVIQNDLTEAYIQLL